MSEQLKRRNLVPVDVLRHPRPAIDDRKHVPVSFESSGMRASNSIATGVVAQHRLCKELPER